MAAGGRFDFDDGGTFCGGWEDGKAHGHGICTGPKNQGEYCGSWNHGFEVTGIYTWPSGNTFEGTWQKGKRSGLGVETKGRWTYKGEWNAGFKGRYGVRSSTTSRAKFEGTWENGLQDGYGTETYADGGVYQGQWMGGMRHGYGVRQSVPYGIAATVSHELRSNSLTSINTEKSMANPDDRLNGTDLNHMGARGGFVLSVGHEREGARSRADQFRDADSVSHYDGRGGRSQKRGFFRGGKLKKAFTGMKRSRSTAGSTISGESFVSRISSTHSMASMRSGQSGYDGFGEGDFEIDDSTQEFYYGEWKNDKRNGSGICERTDGFKYEGLWLNNRRHGYGITTFKDGSREEGKYKHNQFCAVRKSKLSIRSGKAKEKIENALKMARKAAEVAKQKAEIAMTRTQHAVAKASQSDEVAELAKDEAKIARCVAKEMSPEYHQPGLEYAKNAREFNGEYQEPRRSETFPQSGDANFRDGSSSQIYDDQQSINSSEHGQRMPRRRPQKSRDRRNSYAQSQLSGSKSPSSSSLNRLNRRAHKYSENERHRDNRDQQDVEMMEDENGGNNWGGAKSGYSPYESEMNQLQPRQRQHAKSEDDIEYAQPGNSSVMKPSTRRRNPVSESSTVGSEVVGPSSSEVNKIAQDLDMSYAAQGPRFALKKENSFTEQPLQPMQTDTEADWTRYLMLVLIILLNLGFLVLFSHLS